MKIKNLEEDTRSLAECAVGDKLAYLKGSYQVEISFPKLIMLAGRLSIT